MRILFSRFIAIAALAFAVLPSHAMIVFDPQNFGQNIITATKQIYQEIASITAAMHRLEQIKQLTLANTKLSQSDLYALSGIDKNISELNQMLSASRGVQTALGAQGQFIDRLNALYSLTGGKSFQSFAEQQAAQAKQGDRSARALFDESESARKNLESASTLLKKIIDSSGAASGVTEAVQNNTALLDVLVSQQGDLNSMMATNMQEQSRVTARDEVERAAATQSRVNFIDKINADNAARKK